jgi:hypothetical protein
MGMKPLRYAAGVLCLTLAATVASMPVDTAAAVGVPLPAKETSWTHAISQLPELTREVEARHVVALADAKTSLRADVRTADDLFESSKGKATDESRRALKVESNRAYSLVILSDDETAPPIEQVQLKAAIENVKGEVAAWEEAEAKRIAEEARLAAEAASAAAAAAAAASRPSVHRTSGGAASGGAASGGAASGGAASGQTPEQYLEGIAGAYGGSISWSDAPCGHFAGSIGGCFQGGSTVYVSNAAYGSWASAKGRGRNVVLHESSHMIILRTCGTVFLGGDRFENVTDAYSVLLGGGGTGYGYNDNDMAFASAALGGQCLAG